MADELQIEFTNRTMIVRFTRPEIRNPLSVTVLEQLGRIVDNCDSEIERLIFTGTGNVFASGADLREIAEVTTENVREFALRGQLLMAKIEALPQMTTAAINGYCFGGALDLALACNRRIASPDASFAHPGTGLGIITGWGGTQRLPRLIGTAFSTELFFTASPISADRALEIGLVDEIAEDPLAAALSKDNCELTL
jgi:enoyl-CoA hydratase/carnithine racemase